LLGSLILFLIAGAILAALFVCPAAVSAELPMLDLAARLDPRLAYVYAAMLFLGMFGTSLSCMVALLTYQRQKHPALERHKPVNICILGILSWAGSLAGFGNLIAVIYPIFGYIGAAALGCVVAHFVKIRRSEKPSTEGFSA
jgi:uncharacterized membrane protein YkvI